MHFMVIVMGKSIGERILCAHGWKHPLRQKEGMYWKKCSKCNTKLPLCIKCGKLEISIQCLTCKKVMWNE